MMRGVSTMSVPAVSGVSIAPPGVSGVSATSVPIAVTSGTVLDISLASTTSHMPSVPNHLRGGSSAPQEQTHRVSPSPSLRPSQPQVDRRDHRPATGDRSAEPTESDQRLPSDGGRAGVARGASPSASLPGSRDRSPSVLMAVPPGHDYGDGGDYSGEGAPQLPDEETGAYVCLEVYSILTHFVGQRASHVLAQALRVVDSQVPVPAGLSPQAEREVSKALTGIRIHLHRLHEGHGLPRAMLAENVKRLLEGAALDLVAYQQHSQPPQPPLQAVPAIPLTHAFSSVPFALPVMGYSSPYPQAPVGAPMMPYAAPAAAAMPQGYPYASAAPPGAMSYPQMSYPQMSYPQASGFYPPQPSNRRP
jgi:hypothetical protein